MLECLGVFLSDRVFGEYRRDLLTETLDQMVPLPKTSSVQVRGGMRVSRAPALGCSGQGSGAVAEGRGNMIDRAVATGLPGCGERVRHAALAADE
ncbi:hypothetical protein [Streptomyces sp. KR55]|uniref:hypothetical protein n=1 Tax=Streptomyces sp. KR55 TaxID=3457425 RepID=UPI003FD5655C